MASTFNIDRPMTWVEFKKLPDSQKIEYIAYLRERFDVTDKRIAKMLGITAPSLGVAMRKLGCARGHRGKIIEKYSEEFEAWCNGVNFYTIPSHIVTAIDTKLGVLRDFYIVDDANEDDIRRELEDAVRSSKCVDYDRVLDRYSRILIDDKLRRGW